MRTPIWLLLAVLSLPAGAAAGADGLGGQVISVERGGGRLQVQPDPGTRIVEVRIAPRAIPEAVHPGSRVHISGQFQDGRRMLFQGRKITPLAPAVGPPDPTGVRSRLHRRP